MDEKKNEEAIMEEENEEEKEVLERCRRFWELFPFAA